MKIVFKIIGVFLYFNFVSPVLMYYIYDDNPNIGFVAVENSVGTYMKSGFSASKATKRQFTGLYSNPKFPKINSENVVDSHFKVRKTPSKFTISAAVDTGRFRTQEIGKSKAQRIAEEYRNTEAPNRWQQKPPQQKVSTGQQDKQITKVPNKTSVRRDYGAKTKEAASHTQPLNNQQIPPIRPKPVNADYSNSMKQRNLDTGSNQKNQELRRSQTQDGVRNQRQKDVGRSQDQDGNSAYVNVQMNMRKPQTSADPQKKGMLNNNRQLSSLTVLTAQDKRQRLPLSMLMDKTLHKTNGIAHDHNMQVMSRVLDDMTKKIADRRHKKGEYVNRDTEKQLHTIYEKSKRSVVADNMRKYIGKDKIGKELRNPKKHNAARIGSHEESLELDDTPYAVFYRMNPETLDRQEAFMILGSKENNGSEIVSKEQRSHTTFDEDSENMKNKQKSIKNGNTLQRKKLKNFSNYRNH